MRGLDSLSHLWIEQITQGVAFDRAQQSLRAFVFMQTREKDIALFYSLSKEPRPAKQADVPTYFLVPAFVFSELKTAFQIGFLVFIPFLLIDMIVSSTLMSMGMVMLPPTFISLPFKLLLFVAVDGWGLLARGLILGYR